MSDADHELIFEALAKRGVSAERAGAAFERCLEECEFMPKLIDLWRFMPEEAATGNLPPGRRIVRDYFEPYGADHRVHYFELDDGSRQARIEGRA